MIKLDVRIDVKCKMIKMICLKRIIKKLDKYFKDKKWIKYKKFTSKICLSNTKTS